MTLSSNDVIIETIVSSLFVDCIANEQQREAATQAIRKECVECWNRIQKGVVAIQQAEIELLLANRAAESVEYYAEFRPSAFILGHSFTLVDRRSETVLFAAETTDFAHNKWHITEFADALWSKRDDNNLLDWIVDIFEITRDYYHIAISSEQFSACVWAAMTWNEQ